MKYIKLFEDFDPNIKSRNINEEDIIETIKNDGSIYVSSIKNLPNHNKDNPVTPVDIKDGDIIIDIDGELFSTKIEFVEKINNSNNIDI